MIRLDLERELYWLDLASGVHLHVRPCTKALIIAALAAVARGADVEPGLLTSG